MWRKENLNLNNEIEIARKWSNEIKSVGQVAHKRITHWPVF